MVARQSAKSRVCYNMMTFRARASIPDALKLKEEEAEVGYFTTAIERTQRLKAT